jgi:hypothetical protein
MLFAASPLAHRWQQSSSVSDSFTWAAVAQSVLRLATGWTVRGSNPFGRRDFSLPSRPTLGPTQPPIQCAPGLSRG